MVSSSWIRPNGGVCGADDEAGDDVAQHHRLLEAMKQDGHHPGHQHDHGQVLDKADGVHGEGLLEGTGAFPRPPHALKLSQRAEGKVCLDRKKCP